MTAFLMLLPSEHCQAALTAREKIIIAGGVAVTIVVGTGVYYLTRNNNTLSNQERQEFKKMREQSQKLANTAMMQNMDDEAERAELDQTSTSRNPGGIISLLHKDWNRKSQGEIKKLKQDIKKLQDRDATWQKIVCMITVPEQILVLCPGIEKPYDPHELYKGLFPFDNVFKGLASHVRTSGSVDTLD
jgi:gas vesicle protein